MIQRMIGAVVGIIVTVGVLWWNHVDTTLAAIAAIAGAVAAFLWPIVVGFFFARRVKQRAQQMRDEEIQAEVQRQMAAQNDR
jgi:uncharacterized membrane protein YdjX (TVP38/TMEM64 family)